MIQSKMHDCLAELIELGLITEQQYFAAQQHPESAQFQAYISESGHVLAWMVVRNIVPENSLTELLSRRMSPMSDTGHKSREEIIKTAEDYVPRLRQAFNHEALTVLLDELILTKDQLAQAEAKLPSDVAFSSPSEALMWMMLNNLLADNEIAAISDDTEASRAFSPPHKRVEIVDQTSALLEEVQKVTFLAAKKKHWNDLFPGPRWLWVMGFVAFFSYGIWGIFKSDVAPACDAPEVQKSIMDSLFMARIDASRPSYMFSDREDNSAVLPSLRAPHETGYAKVENARGCLASLTLGDIEEPYAYTVKLPSGKKRGYKITRTSPEIVQARYAHIDANGEFGNRAEPVGRAALESAIRDGVKKFNESAGVKLPDTSDREIADLEPKGNCRELAAGNRYSCEVLMERHDPFLSALRGNEMSIVKGDFTIERDRTGTFWHVSKEFATQYLAAIQGARIKTLPILR
jgi:hypothetical protein